jgi:transposase
MKKFTTFVGIDISKKTFDAAIYVEAKNATALHQAFQQTQTGYTAFLTWLQDQSLLLADTLFCMEHTGIYINGLVHFLHTAGLSVWVEMPLRIKKSMGLQRGGNDKVASIGIAQYAFRYQDAAKLYSPIDNAIEELQHLTAQRTRLINSITQLEVPLKEMMECGDVYIAKNLIKLQQQAISGLRKSLTKIETAITKHIKANTDIKNKIERVTSIKGIGQQTAINMYVYTKGFTAFENAKQLACYCGVVPFTKSSGTSVRYKTRVSPFANKNLKKLLHLCAMAAIQWNDELKQYYERKVAEGKNKMSVINAVRNKLVHRIFAVLRDDRLFVENYVYKQ